MPKVSIKQRNDKFQQNITKRGLVKPATSDSESKSSVGPIMIGFFLFVVVGSALFDIIRRATRGSFAE